MRAGIQEIYVAIRPWTCNHAFASFLEMAALLVQLVTLRRPIVCVAARGAGLAAFIQPSARGTHEKALADPRQLAHTARECLSVGVLVAFRDSTRPVVFLLQKLETVADPRADFCAPADSFVCI